MKKINKILSLIFLIAVITVIADTTILGELSNPSEIITDEMTIGNISIIIIYLIILIIIQIYLLKKILKKNSWVFWSILLISATGGLGWIIVIIMAILIKYEYIDPNATYTYTKNYEEPDNRTDAQKYYIDKLMKPENFDCMGNRKLGKW